jgi:hypothetical protein
MLQKFLQQFCTPKKGQFKVGNDLRTLEKFLQSFCTPKKGGFTWKNFCRGSVPQRRGVSLKIAGK